jgi:hypothetical protein
VAVKRLLKINEGNWQLRKQQRSRKEGSRRLLKRPSKKAAKRLKKK